MSIHNLPRLTRTERVDLRERERDVNGTAAYEHHGTTGDAPNLWSVLARDCSAPLEVANDGALPIQRVHQEPGDARCRTAARAFDASARERDRADMNDPFERENAHDDRIARAAVEWQDTRP